MRALVSLNNAWLYCKPTQEETLFTEARHFLDDYMSQVVAVLLHEINFGDVSTLESDRIKSCLVSALALVLNDLEDAVETPEDCKTLSALLLIFAKVDGYQESGLSEMRFQIRMADGIRNLGLYLSWITGGAGEDSFPLDSVTSILSLVTDSIYSVNRDDAFILAQSVMTHLSSLGEEELTFLGDDSIDVWHNVKQIYCHPHCEGQTSSSIFEYYSMFCKFIL